MSKRAPSRRAILGSGASLLLLTAAAAGQAKAQELDGELLHHCRAYLDLERRVQTISDEIEAASPLTAEQDREAFGRMGDLQGEQTNRLDEIEMIPARTPEGLRAKALVLEAELRDQQDPEGCFPDQRDGIAWSLVQDVLGRPA